MYTFFLPTKGKALPHIVRYVHNFHTIGRVNSGQAALSKLAYSEAAGQPLAYMNEYESSETYHPPSIDKKQICIGNAL